MAQIWMQILFKVAQFWMPFNTCLAPSDMYSGGATRSPWGCGSCGLVLHFCRVPLSFLISVGSGFRPAIWVQSLVIVNMEASNSPENSQCAKSTSSLNASFSPLWRLI